MSGSSSHKNKYVYNPLIEEEGDETVAVRDSDTFTPMASLHSTKLPIQSTQPELHTLSNELDTPTIARSTPPTKSMPAVGVTSPLQAKDGCKEGGKEIQLQSVSQLSLSKSTPTRGKRETGEAVKKAQSRLLHSSRPVVKTTLQ